MPFDVERDDRRGWIIATGRGVLTLPDVAVLIQTARAPIERRMWPMLVDTRGIVSEITEREIEEAVGEVQRAAQAGPRGHVAIVADDDRLFDLLLFYEARCAEINVRVIRVFRQRTDAEHWLEIVSAARHFG